MLVRIQELLDQTSLGPLRLAVQRIAQHQSAALAGDTQTPGDGSKGGTSGDISLDIDEAGKALGDAILHVLSNNASVAAHAFPHRFGRPRFTALYEGQAQAWHTDVAVTQTVPRIRTDLTAFIFLSDADAYDGGSLLLRDGADLKKVRLSAGDAIIAPSSVFRAIEQVEEGECLMAAVGIQSVIRDRGHRAILADVNAAVVLAKSRGAEASELALLQRAHGALMREWAEV